MKDDGKKILYIDCFSGISGDMFLGALMDLGIDKKQFEEEISKILPPEGRIKIQKIKKGPFTGTKFDVEISKKEVKERHLKDIKTLLDKSALSKTIINKSKKMFDELAEIEAGIHGVSKEKIHFHELGAIDSIADIVGASLAIELLGLKKIYFSTINVGSGYDGYPFFISLCSLSSSEYCCSDNPLNKSAIDKADSWAKSETRVFAEGEFCIGAMKVAICI